MTERNNLDRVAMPEHDHPPRQEMPQMQTPQPKELEFSVPTEFVELPSKGRYYPQGHPLHGKDTVEIKFMTAKEEDILASTSLIKRGVVFDRLLQSILMDNIDPNDFLLGDKNAVLVAARVSGYGDEYNTDVTCPSCKTKSRYMFNLSESFIGVKENHGLKFPNVKETENGTFIISLSRIGAEVEVRLLTGHDEKRLNSIASSKNKNNLMESMVTDALKTYIVSVNGETSPGYINQFVDTLPARESRSIRITYKAIAPKISIEGTYSCANCAHEQELEVPFNIDFFWPDE
jgi:hypothetical protein